METAVARSGTHVYNSRATDGVVVTRAECIINPENRSTLAGLIYFQANKCFVFFFVDTTLRSSTHHISFLSFSF